MLFSAIISVLSLIIAVFSCFKYYRADKRLKQQEKILNELDIERLKRETDKWRQANIRAETTERMGEHVVMLISNVGQCVAQNIRISSPHIDNGDCGIYIIMPQNFSSIPILNPGDNYKIELQVQKRNPQTEVTFIWNDDTGNDIAKLQIINVS